MSHKADIPFIASRLREAADRLDNYGTTAWNTTDAWARGAGTANYDPESGGNRWWEDDDGNVYPVPSDPTGDRALSIEEVNGLHDTYRNHLDVALSVADALIRDVTAATPRRPGQIADQDKLATQVGAEGWCSSCFRNGGKLVPQAMHSSGEVKYRGSCRWCHDFESEYGRRAPLSLLQKRHAGQRITTTDILRALGIPRAKAS